ncbi:MAG: IS30 family transposase [Lachnospiraceae bacterium]|nr:IS30 family transposase [Lachnospiraceae bacterium]
MRKYHHLKYPDRLRIETCLRTNTPYKTIANLLGVHVSTIYREVERGKYLHRNSEWIDEERYSCDKAEEQYQQGLRDKGTDLKIGSDHAYADYIEHMICDEKYSVDAALASAKAEGFATSVTRTTIYSYIDKGIFYRLTNKDLPVRGKKKHKYRKIRAKSLPKGTSIDKRPKVVYSRKDFGHWEMDLVVGKRKRGSVLCVMTERKTRDEIIRKMSGKAAENVVNMLNGLEADYGERFRNIFKSITVDNGVEFSDQEGMETSIYGGKRTAVYYCHPYCASERGSNENNNKLIRRHIPKGEDIDKVSVEEVQRIEDWINNYPRRLFGWRSAADMFRESVALIE